MSSAMKGMYHRALKAEGVPLAKHYRDYTIDELAKAYDALAGAGVDSVPGDVTQHQANVDFSAAKQATPEPQQRLPQQPPPQPRPADKYADVPVAGRDHKELAGVRVNQIAEGEPIRRDPITGFVWFQEEVTKPSYPKPRGRRKLTYTETGVKEVSIPDEGGVFSETFEMAGDEQARTSEVKVTLPSFQVGCYFDSRFPFKIHVYNENRGFDLHDVEKYYGGRELVPQEVLRKYVENVLCYDIPTVIRAIQTEARDLQLGRRL